MTTTYETRMPQHAIKDDALVAGNFRRASEGNDILTAAETLASTLNAVRKRNESCGLEHPDARDMLQNPPTDAHARLIYRIAAEYLLIMEENESAAKGTDAY